MTERQFDNGYWYATELKAFARELGIAAASRLRKDQLENAIKKFLRTGKVDAKPKLRGTKKGPRDTETKLTLGRKILNYTNDKETKDFLLTQAKRLDPQFKLQSGTRYPLNRWREEQIAAGFVLTYRQLVEHFVVLNKGPRTPLRTEHGRYNNFVADFRKAKPKAPKGAMIRAWEQLKELDAPKTYKAWVRHSREKDKTL